MPGALGSDSVTLDGSGGGSVTVGPAVFGSSWVVTTMTVNSTSAANQNPTVKVYLNSVLPTALLDSSYSGNQDTSDTVVRLTAPDKLIFVFAGGTPGATGTAIVYGELETGR